MRYLSVCSGIKAFSVAWPLLEWRPPLFAEIDPFCGEGCWNSVDAGGYFPVTVGSRPLLTRRPDRKEREQHSSRLRRPCVSHYLAGLRGRCKTFHWSASPVSELWPEAWREGRSNCTPGKLHQRLRAGNPSDRCLRRPPSLPYFPCLPSVTRVGAYPTPCGASMFCFALAGALRVWVSKENLPAATALAGEIFLGASAESTSRPWEWGASRRFAQECPEGNTGKYKQEKNNGTLRKQDHFERLSR
jgi:hypothetical protein